MLSKELCDFPYDFDRPLKIMMCAICSVLNQVVNTSIGFNINSDDCMYFFYVFSPQPSQGRGASIGFIAILFISF
jgi:hypothetical protein